MDIPIRVPAAFRVIAHRGSSAYAPENTRPAFELARAMGIAEIETDVQLTTDGVVVLCHDTGLENATGTASGASRNWRPTIYWRWIWARGTRCIASLARR